jgi:hypothetical protein
VSLFDSPGKSICVTRNVRFNVGHENESVPLFISAETHSFFHSQSKSTKLCVPPVGYVNKKKRLSSKGILQGTRGSCSSGSDSSVSAMAECSLMASLSKMAQKIPMRCKTNNIPNML